ncbi:hypothetical protein [Rhodopseudomonas palustris]|uniref:hypothetical protein n=1 Tax=Rhodopseudomonas palustris TaxID=1076 RepID=UPI00123728CA|nr:hypothetical protein [Rhodopseudomonas palustris]
MIKEEPEIGVSLRIPPSAGEGGSVMVQRGRIGLVASSYPRQNRAPEGLILFTAAGAVKYGAVGVFADGCTMVRRRFSRRSCRAGSGLVPAAIWLILAY